MRIVCLTRGRPHHNYFVNEIHRHHPISLLVVEAPPAKNKFRRSLKQRGIVGFSKLVFQHYVATSRARQVLNSTFGDSWKTVHGNLEVIQTESINDAVVRDKLLGIRPNVILDHGTSIVNDQILDTSELALNLHWGLSPYYRGTSCTEWALINRDPYNIGVTIHKLSKSIDGGQIIAQRRVDVRTNDNVNSINYRLTHNGTDLIIEILDRLKAGKSLEIEEQEFSQGFLYLNRHLDEKLRQYVRRIETSPAIESMLVKPARKEKVPIVEL